MDGAYSEPKGFDTATFCIWADALRASYRFVIHRESVKTNDEDSDANTRKGGDRNKEYGVNLDRLPVHDIHNTRGDEPDESGEGHRNRHKGTLADEVADYSQSEQGETD